MSFIERLLQVNSIENFLHLIHITDLQQIIHWNNCTSYSYRRRDITLSRNDLELTINNLLLQNVYNDEYLIYLENLEIRKLKLTIKKYLLKKYNVSEE